MWELLRSTGRPAWSAMGVLAVLVTLLVGYLYLRERFEDLMNRCVPAGAALIQVAFVGGLVLSGTGLVYLILRKAFNLYLDVRDDRPAKQKFRDCGKQMVKCANQLSWLTKYPGGTSRPQFVSYVTELRALSLVLRELGIWAPPTEKLDLWEEYIARLRVLASHGDLEEARRYQPSQDAG